MLKGRAGYTFFKDIEVNHYLFAMLSTTPLQKVSDTHFVEVGTDIQYPMEAEERVIPIETVKNGRGRPTHIKIGHHIIPL